MTRLGVAKTELEREKRGIETLSQCVTVRYPTLRDIGRFHDKQTAVEIIKCYVINLNDNCNVNRMVVDRQRGIDQVTETSRLIYDEAPMLTVLELHEFFRRLKAGRYGKFYGSVDVVSVMDAFQEFLTDKNAAIMQAEKKRQEERKAYREWFRSLTPEHRKKVLPKMTEGQKISVGICPKCGGHLVADYGSLGEKCLKCDFKTNE